jgi:hypothetical protein
MDLLGMLPIVGIVFKSLPYFICDNFLHERQLYEFSVTR